MDALFIIGLILYVLFSILGKNRRKQQQAAQREAERNVAARRATEQRAGTPSAHGSSAAQPVRPQPARAAEQHWPAAAFPARPGASSAATSVEEEGAGTAVAADASMEGMDPTAPKAHMRTEMASRLSQIRETTRHALEASSLTGHAHEETSLSGDAAECPSEAKRGPVRPSDAPSTAFVPVRTSALSWNAPAVRAGFLYAEILGKPKALRRR